MNNIQQSRGPASWRGFSLIELMVVLAVFAVLSVMAVNSYRRYTLRATRTEGRLALLAIQVAEEKYFLQNSQYAQDIATVIAAPGRAGHRQHRCLGRDHWRELHHQFCGSDGDDLYPAGGRHGQPDQGHGRLPDLHHQRPGCAHAGGCKRLLALIRQARNVRSSASKRGMSTRKASCPSSRTASEARGDAGSSKASAIGACSWMGNSRSVSTPRTSAYSSPPRRPLAASTAAYEPPCAARSNRPWRATSTE